VHGFGADNRVDTAEKILPETETTGHFDVTTPASTAISVPSAEHLYDGLLFGQPLTIKADVAIEGATFSLVTQIKRDVTPPVEIVRVDPKIYVTTPATSQKPLEFKVRVVNHLANEFRGVLRVVGPSLETGLEVVLGPHSSDVVNLSVTAGPVSKRNKPKTDVVISVDQTVPKKQ